MAAESQHGPRAGAERWVRWLGMAAIAGCVAWQTWPWLGEPLLPFEDGAVLLPRHYARFDLLRCFDSYAGYIAFGSNLLAALCCLLPTTWIATAFVVAAAAATVAAASPGTIPSRNGVSGSMPKIFGS